MTIPKVTILEEEKPKLGHVHTRCKDMIWKLREEAWVCLDVSYMSHLFKLDYAKPKDKLGHVGMVPWLLASMVDTLLLLFLHSTGKAQAVERAFNATTQALCSKARTKVILTDHNYSNFTGFVLSGRAFQGMAITCLGRKLSCLGIMDVEYKRVPCDYKNKTLAVRVEEFSKKPNYLAIKVLYQGGQTDISGIDVVKVGLSIGTSMSRNFGAKQSTTRAIAAQV
ncbi:Expansin-like A3-like protein [Drosera capensis]